MPTLRQFARDFAHFNTARIRPSTAAKYDSALRLHILPRLGDKQLHQITTRDALDLQAALSSTAAIANTATMVLLRVLKVARLLGFKTLPVERPRGFREPQRMRFLAAEERERLTRVLRREPSIAARLIELILMTGLRRGEALKLRWSEVDLERGLLALASTKTGPSIRALPEPAVALLGSLPRSSEWVFPGSAGHFTFLGRFWNRARAAAQLPDLRIHDLRHDFASRAVAAGVPLYTVSKLLGHTNPSTTARYAHLAPGALREAAELANRP